MGLAMGLVTNKPEAFTTPLVSALGLDPFLSVSVSGDTLAVKKPDPAPLQHAAQQMGVAVDRCLYVGDSRADLDAAEAAGKMIVRVPHGYPGGADASADRPQLLTFFYSHCNSVCPVLISALRNVQTHALNEGYGDEVAFHPTTFDPDRDDADRLRTYGEEMNVDLAAGNWRFLRPASSARAEGVVAEQFGVSFERTHPEGMDMYMFAHAALTLLVNADGYVERAYREKQPDPGTMTADLATVRNG
jgi:protein SCO1/2